VKLRQSVVERDQVAEAIDRLQLAVLHQFIRQRDAIDALTSLVQISHPQENALVLFQAEVFGCERARYLQKRRLTAHDGAQNKSYRVDIVRQSLVDAEITYRHRRRPD